MKPSDLVNSPLDRTNPALHWRVLNDDADSVHKHYIYSVNNLAPPNLYLAVTVVRLFVICWKTR